MTAVRSLVTTVGVRGVGPYVAGMNSMAGATGRFGAAAKTVGPAAATAHGGLAKMATGAGLLNPKLLGPAGLVMGFKAAASSSINFGEEQLKLQTQIGLTADQAEFAGQAAREIGVQYGIGGQEAMEASYFIHSAGLRGKDATDALAASAKASALGLGETAVVADLVTSAMNAYGPEVLGAGRATEVLLAAVREGKAEASEFAGSLGSVLPIASAMGVQFEELTGAVAAMTRTGSSPAEAVTQLTGVLIGIQRPADDAAKAFDEYGISADGLRRTIREDGLLAGLEALQEATGGNAEAFAAMFPNLRGYRGVLDLLGESADTTAGIMDNVTDSVGMLDEAMDELDESSTRFAANQLWAKLKDIGQDVGDTVHPAIRFLIDDLNQTFEPGTLGSWALGGIGSTGKLLTNPVKWGADVAADFLAGRDAVASFGEATGEASGMTDLFVGSIDAAASAGPRATSEIEALHGALTGQAGGAAEASEALQAYADAVEAQHNPLLNLRRAINDQREAQAALNEMRSEGVTKGRDYESALWDLIVAEDGVEAAALRFSEQGGARSLQTLRDLERQNILTKDEVRLLTANIGDLETQADSAARDYRLAMHLDNWRTVAGQLDGVERRAIEASKDRSFGITANTDTATRKVGDLANAIARIPRSVTTTVSVVGGGMSGSTGAKPRAAGGPVWPGQTFLVGEEGPELVQFGGRGNVIPAPETSRAMAATTKPGGEPAINVGPFYGADRSTMREAEDSIRLAHARGVFG